MKVRSIVMSAREVQAILAGRKTQFRRVVQVQLRNLYEVGDRLWVKEAFFDTEPHNGAALFASRLSRFAYEATGEFIGCHRWRSPRFMPRGASRLTLEVVAVRVERLQAITEADAIAEGIRPLPGSGFGINEPFSGENSAREAFAHFWDQTNGKKHPWSANPWVRAVTFKPVEVAQ